MSTAAQVAASLGLALTVAIAGLVLWRRWAMSRIRALTPIRSPGGIEESLRIPLGSFPQRVLVRGEDRDAPLLLYLHGGPGEPFLAEARSYLPELESRYTVAYWAQRGTLGSYRRSLPRASITTEQLLADTAELIELLCQRYARERLFLMAGSWGTVLGAITAARHPERLHAYVARSQVVDNPAADAHAVRFVLEHARADGRARLVRRMERLLEGGAPVGPLRGAQVVREVGRYGGYAEPGARARAPGLPLSIPTQLVGCPDVSAVDLLHALSAPLVSARALWPETQRFRLADHVTRIDVPVWFLQGRGDVMSPTHLVEAFHEHLDAPVGKHLVVFERSQHLIHLTERDAYLDWLVRRIPEAVLGA